MHIRGEVVGNPLPDGGKLCLSWNVDRLKASRAIATNESIIAPTQMLIIHFRSVPVVHSDTQRSVERHLGGLGGASVITTTTTAYDFNDIRDHMITLTAKQRLRMIRTWLYISGVWFVIFYMSIGLLAVAKAARYFTDADRIWAFMWIVLSTVPAFYIGFRWSGRNLNPRSLMFMQACTDRGVDPKQTKLACITPRRWPHFIAKLRRDRPAADPRFW